MGVGTNAPTQAIELGGVAASIKLPSDGSLFLIGTRFATNNGSIYFGDVNALGTPINLIPQGGGANGSINFGAVALAQFKGKGSTSATTSLLVQNSAGTGVMKVTDDGLTAFGPNFLGVRISEILPGYGRIRGYNGLRLDDDLNVHMDMPYNQNTRLPRQVIVGANTTQDASSQLQIDSTTKGFLPPRMTTTQKNAIATPASLPTLSPTARP